MQSVDVKNGHCTHEFLSSSVEGWVGDWSEHHFGRVDGDGAVLLGGYVFPEQ